MTASAFLAEGFSQNRLRTYAQSKQILARAA